MDDAFENAGLVIDKAIVRLDELQGENQRLVSAGTALIEQIDLLMPVIEKALKTEWDRGNYINGPRFGGALVDLRNALASVDRNPEGEKPQALSAKHESAARDSGDAHKGV